MKSCSLLSIILCLITTSYPQNKLKLDWGLESTQYFQEVLVPRGYSSAIRAEAKEGEKLYRFFKVNDAYDRNIIDVFTRHRNVWDLYVETLAEGEKPDRMDFIAYAKSNDPFYLGRVESMAPVLYFDFVGNSQEYVLESIEINTIDFEEYMGGGFFLNTAWYDIELKHQIGKHTYPVNKKLKFNGSGRAELRFWSDNYYENMGMSPMGCYLIKIKFNFTSNGKLISVETEPFKIDV